MGLPAGRAAATVSMFSTRRRAEDPPGSYLSDRTLQLLRQGYLFLPTLRWEHSSDVVGFRLLGQRAICVSGTSGAELLYERPEIQRHDAVPVRVRRTLMGDGGVQTLDGFAHRHRKSMFMAALSSDRVRDLVAEVETEVERQHDEWMRQGTVNVLEGTRDVLMAAVARWAGVPLPAIDLGRRAHDMAAMVTGFASVGPRYWRARIARRRSEEWAQELVEVVRTGTSSVETDSVLAEVALHEDESGELLPASVAGVELLNILRPTVAVNRFAAFLALALHEHGEEPSDEQERRHYVQEVRRFYPFTPFVGGSVVEAFEWRGFQIPRGAMVLLDVYGLNHDPEIWDSPQRFAPDRFRSRAPTAYEFAPQGGGDHARHHRCAGEEPTIALMEGFCRFFTDDMSADLPPQDLSVDLGRIPTQPASGVVLANLGTHA